MLVADTNGLVHAAGDSASHDRLEAGVDESRRQETVWHTTRGILHEFLGITTHPGSVIGLRPSGAAPDGSFAIAPGS